MLHYTTVPLWLAIPLARGSSSGLVLLVSFCEQLYQKNVNYFTARVVECLA
jgi:hypothetical protein